MLQPNAPDTELSFYEGLVFKTTERIWKLTGDDFEDVQQELRVKVWQALGTYDPMRSRMKRKAYVFGCMLNKSKDLLKRGEGRRRRGVPLLIEDVASEPARERFEGRYLSVDQEQAFAEIEAEGMVLPSTLTEAESHIVLLLYLDYSPREVADVMGTTKKAVDVLIESVRAKLADWAPTGESLLRPVVRGRAAVRGLPGQEVLPA